MNEADFKEMSDRSLERPLQLPIRSKRFRYLINEYQPKADDKWVMNRNNDHFLIYNTATKKCVFDAFYSAFEGDSDKDNDIKAVVFKYRYNKEELERINEEDGFNLLVELISKAL